MIIFVCQLTLGKHSNPKLTSDDVTTALNDMHAIYNALLNLITKVESWSRTDVGIACYLFFFMTEVAWTPICHAAIGSSPEPFSKQHTTPSKRLLMSTSHNIKYSRCALL